MTKLDRTELLTEARQLLKNSKTLDRRGQIIYTISENTLSYIANIINVLPINAPRPTLHPLSDDGMGLYWGFFGLNQRKSLTFNLYGTGRLITVMVQNSDVKIDSRYFDKLAHEIKKIFKDWNLQTFLDQDNTCRP
jgi:hypothetical protein